MRQGEEIRWLNLKEAETTANNFLSINFKKEKKEVCVRMSQELLVEFWLGLLIKATK